RPKPDSSGSKPFIHFILKLPLRPLITQRRNDATKIPTPLNFGTSAILANGKPGDFLILPLTSRSSRRCVSRLFLVFWLYQSFYQNLSEVYQRAIQDFGFSNTSGKVELIKQVAYTLWPPCINFSLPRFFNFNGIMP
ncbi:MAG: hypothetical protein P8Z70_12925, partial [Desulfuromonadales bacterium]